MHIEYGHAVIEIRQLHIYLTVKTSGSEQCLVKNIGTVCRSKNYHTAIRAEAVHLGQKLVKSVFSLVVSTHVRITSAGTTDSVNLIDEHYTGGFFLGLTEQVSYSRCSYSDKHLHKITARHGKKRHIRFSGHSLCKQRFARTGRAYKQCTFRYFTTELSVSLRIFKKFYYLLNLSLGLRKPCYIFESHFNRTVLVKNLRL